LAVFKHRYPLILKLPERGSFCFFDMYYLYILKCSDGTLYTGVTTDLGRRVREHNSSKLGAKYTRMRRPVKLAYSKKFKNRSKASAEEYKIKSLNRTEKLKLLGV